jgi:Short C-terminal domain
MTGNTKKRKLGIGALVFLGSFLLFVAIFATWVDRVALDSGNWSDTSTQVLEQPAVRTALSQYLVDQAYANVDVPAVLETALPPRAKPLAGPIATYIQPYLQRAVAAGLERPRLVALWRAANLRAHDSLMTILNGGTGIFSTQNGTVVIGLGPMVSQFSAQLSQRTNGAVTLPPGTGNIVLLKSDQLATAQTGVKLMRLLSLPLALAALALLAIAVAISRERRKTLRAVAIGVLLAGLLLIFIRRVVGDALVDALTTNPVNRDAGHAVWWVATEKLASANITTVTVGLLLLIGTWFAGPGRRATTARGNLTPYLRDPAIAYGTYAGIVLVLLVWAPVEAARDATTAIILIVLGAIGIEALRRLSIREFPDRTERDLGQRLGHSWTSMRERRSKQPAPAEAGKYSDLERLASLHDRGVLTDAEFNAEKSAVLKA